MKDAEWIAQLLRSGLLDASFIPSKPVRELRELTRYRKTMVEETASQKNRVEKFLQSAGFKLSTFCTDVFGVSGKAILEHLALHGSISSIQSGSTVKRAPESQER
jgi:poly(A) polymerase Pap1